jgi:hypothetical protein
MTNKHPLVGNKHRQIGDAPMSSVVVLRVTREEKGRWVQKARPRPLAEWIRGLLNKAAK